jgi:hypothetical protein
LLAEETNASNYILNIVRSELHDVCCNLAGLGLGVVVERLTVLSSNTEDNLMRVNLVTEVSIVHLISVTLVHIASQDQVKYWLWSKDAKLSKNS